MALGSFSLLWSTLKQDNGGFDKCPFGHQDSALMPLINIQNVLFRFRHTLLKQCFYSATRAKLLLPLKIEVCFVALLVRCCGKIFIAVLR